MRETNLEDVWYRVNAEGFDYTFEGYYSVDNLPVQLRALAKDYLDARGRLMNRMKELGYREDVDY